ncbi:MAG: DUF2213 domain-containing protein [Intestinimonas sp.]
MDGYRQTNLVGNHVAVVPRGRGGPQCCNKRPRRRKGGERTETNEKKRPKRRSTGSSAWRQMTLHRRSWSS